MLDHHSDRYVDVASGDESESNGVASATEEKKVRESKRGGEERKEGEKGRRRKYEYVMRDGLMGWESPPRKKKRNLNDFFGVLKVYARDLDV